MGLAVLDLTLAHHDLNPTAPVALYTRPPAALATALDPEDGRLFAWDYLEPGASRRHLGRDIPYFLARAPVGWDLRAAQALALREALFPPSAASWGAEGSYDRDVPGLEPGPLALLKAAFRSASAEQRLRLLRVGAVSRVAALHADAGRGLQPLARYEGSFVDPVLVFAVPGRAPARLRRGHRARRGATTRRRSRRCWPRFRPGARGRPRIGARRRGRSAFAGSARVLERRADRVTLEAEANGPGWLVLVDAWDPGWLATRRRPAGPVSSAPTSRSARWRSPQGRHHVEFVYRPAVPRARRCGSPLASLALLAGGAWIVRPRSFGGVAAPAASAP